MVVEGTTERLPREVWRGTYGGEVFRLTLVADASAEPSQSDCPRVGQRLLMEVREAQAMDERDDPWVRLWASKVRSTLEQRALWAMARTLEQRT